ALLHGAPVGLIEPVWLVGLAIQFAVTVWVIARWIGGRIAWSSITPILYIPMVGNILVPLAGVPLGQIALSWLFFGVGAFFWPVLTALVLARLAHQPLPDRLMPTWFITIAPPAVFGLAAITLGMTAALLPAA
ncbi:MAG: C4-dicarboxylate ABC transporter, partial [Quisquiliibacterium sp.]